MCVCECVCACGCGCRMKMRVLATVHVALTHRATSENQNTDSWSHTVRAVYCGRVSTDKHKVKGSGDVTDRKGVRERAGRRREDEREVIATLSLGAFYWSQLIGCNDHQQTY